MSLKVFLKSQKGLGMIDIAALMRVALLSVGALVASCSTMDGQPVLKTLDKKAVGEVDGTVNVDRVESDKRVQQVQMLRQKKSEKKSNSNIEKHQIENNVGNQQDQPIHVVIKKRAYNAELPEPKRHTTRLETQSSVKESVKKPVKKLVKKPVEMSTIEPTMRTVAGQMDKRDGIARKIESEIAKGKVVEKVVETGIDKAIEEEIKPEQEIMIESIDQLPLALGSGWYLDGDALGGASLGCTITSRDVTIDDGHGGTPLEFQISLKEIKVKTHSNIDISYENDGLIIDHQPPIETDFVRNQQTVIFKVEPQAFIKQLEEAKKMSVHLGFWPTWPVTHTHQATLDVTDLNRAGQWLAQCNSLLER